MEFKEYPCDLCGSEDAIEVPHVRLYTGNQPYHICKKCGLVYARTRRNSKGIADFWSNEWFGKRYTARIPAVKARQTYAAEFIDANIGFKGKKVCDIGTGEGQFLEIIRNDEYGANVFGVEASKENCSGLSEKGLKHFNGSIEDFCANPESKTIKADIVTILWTLEACSSCKGMLSNAYQILDENGYIAIGTGSRILVPFKKPLYDYFSNIPSDAYAFRFSVNTLTGLLAVSGFEVIHVNRYMDSDPLCVIARKKDKSAKIAWQGDDFLKVYDFFDRWHKESIFYR